MVAVGANWLIVVHHESWVYWNLLVMFLCGGEDAYQLIM